MIYGYARVSSVGQAIDGNSLDIQETTLRDHGAVKIFRDSFTGTKADRPELAKLLSVATDGDTIIVTKLDRVARSVSAGIGLIDSIISRGVRLHILNMGLMDNSPSGRLLRTVMLAFAEFERDMIVERTQEGKMLKRQTDPNYKEGRRPKRPDAFQKILKKQKRGLITVEQGCSILNIGRTTWYRLASQKEVKG